MIKVERVKEKLDKYCRHYPYDLQIMKLEHLEQMLENCLGIGFAIELNFLFLFSESELPTLLSCYCPEVFSYLRWFCVVV